MIWENKFNALATYNSELSRGILHKEEYKRKMKDLQEEYDRKLKKFYEASGVSDNPL